jgi:hypothetical protein
MHRRRILLTVSLLAASSWSTPNSVLAATCDMTGSYRFRFLSNGHEGWWFRFDVAGTPAKATLVEDVEVLALKAGPLETTADPQQCRLTLRAKGEAVGQLALTIDPDAKASTFNGKLTRTKATDTAEKNIAIQGVHTLGTQQPSSACIVPGIYRLDFDPKARWRNENKDDRRSCKRRATWPRPVFVRVEPFGKKLAIGERESEPPYKEAWAIDSVEQHDECDVTAKIGDSELTLKARLKLAEDGITGTAVEVTQQFYQDEGNIWNCVGKGIQLKITRVQ